MPRHALMAALLASAALAAPIAAAAAPAGAASADSSPFAGVKYRLVGPFRGGRAAAVSGVAQQPNVYYLATAGGGVWKTTDSGTSWHPLWDNFPEASPSVGAVVVAPSDPNVVYAGTGEANIRGNVITGNGVYKSSDAGKTWAFVGLRDSGAIGRMAVHPSDPDTVLVAALGHPFGANSERGIYRTSDGGKTWQRTLAVDDRTGGIDVQYDPSNPKIVYAAMWQVVRKPWIMESGGPGSGLYRSTDGGATWTKLTGHGLPDGVLGRIGVAPTRDPNRIYALIEAEKGGLYRTDDGGANWQLINNDNRYRQRAWYYTNVIADPKDPDKVFIMNTGAYKSTDGGKTFKGMPTFHGDNHAIWINPIDTDRMVNANDGGGDVSVDGGKTWSTEMNQPTAQFYHVAVDNRVPYHIYGAQQDNTTVEIASGNVRGKIGEQDWHSVGGGESGYVVAKPDDPSIVVANGYGGNVDRYDDRTGAIVSINPWARQVMGWAPKDLTHRSQWTEPLAFSPSDPNVLYNANEVLFRSTDLGQSWTVISPDLTRNDKSKQLSSGGPLTKDNTGIETYDTIFSVVESPVQKGLIWVGTDDGLVQLTTDGGAQWRSVTPKEMPEWGTVDMIEADPHKAGTAYIAVDGHRLDDFRPHAFRTDDFGKTWVSITNGLPEDAYVHAVRADPARPGLLFAATEKGVFTSFDDGGRWEPLQLNLPRVPVHDLLVHDGDLVVATHGRAFWVLDDISPIRQWSDAVRNQDFHLFAVRPTQRVIYSGRGDMTGKFVGDNPPNGVVINYFVSKGGAPDQDSEGKTRGGKENSRVKIEILDASDHVVNTYPDPHKIAEAGKPGDHAEEDDDDFRAPKPAPVTDHSGLNRFVWNMRYEGAEPIPKTALWAGSLDGPYALPGHYAVRVTVDGQTQTQPFDILPDPRLRVSETELKKQFDLSLALIAELKTVQSAILEMRALHAQVAALRSAAGGAVKSAALLQAADTLERKTTAVEDELIQRKAIANEDPLNFPIRLNNMLASLNGLVNRGSGAPTQADFDEFNQLRTATAQHLAQWNQIKSADLAAFNALARRENATPITLASR